MKANKEQLKAIECCDKSYDGVFYYGVKSTKIFCKPSCHSKMPNIMNIEVFDTVTPFLDMGFRPCKRCKPTDRKLPDEDWIEQVQYFIHNHYSEKITLQRIADETHSSPYHLHRKFKELTSKTIREYVYEVRMKKAIMLLDKTSSTIATIGKKVGIANGSQFTRDFKKFYGETPMQYKNKKAIN